MKDPVNDFEIPENWLAKSPLPKPELEDLIRRGLIVMLSDGSHLRRGFTTGTTATAAAKAATLSLFGREIKTISVPTPIGLRADMPVDDAENGVAHVRKVDNDHESDITRDVIFRAEAQIIDLDALPTDLTKKAVVASDCTPACPILVTGGTGIGIVKRGGFETPVGDYAINPKPFAQIQQAVREALLESDCPNIPDKKCLLITISIPEGVELSKKTLNEKIGIVGGISILGTTGFVEPWNDQLGKMKDVLIQNAKRLVLTTGRQGMALASMFFPGCDIVMVGSRISEGIDAAVCADEIVVFGLPGLILKWGDPDITEGTKYATVAEMVEQDDWSAMKPAFDAAIKKGRGARIVIADREGVIYRDSMSELDAWRNETK